MRWLKIRPVYPAAGVIQVRSRTAYLGDFLGGMFTYGLFVAIFALIWAQAFAHQSTIAGYTREQATWYFIIAELSLFLGGSLFRNLAAEVKSGAVAAQLGRPYGFLSFQYSLAAGSFLVDLAVLGSLGVVLGLAFAGPLPLALWQIPLALLSLILAFTLAFFLQAILALTAFWLEENSAFFWIYQKLSLVIGTLAPLEFLPQGVQGIVLWTPFPYLSWAPARLVTHGGSLPSGDLWGILAGQTAWTLAAGFLALGFFTLVRKKLSVQGG